MIRKARARTPLPFSVVAMAIVSLTAASANAGWIAYHDFGAITGQESTGNITTHQIENGTTVPADTDAKNLIKYSDGTDTGVDFSVAGANGMDSRNGGQTAPPAVGTPADPLFNVAGLNLNNGMIFEGGTGGSGATTFTLSGLAPGFVYDVAFYGDRAASADGLERFTLGGADSATNSSSYLAGVIDAFNADMETRPNSTAGNVVRWTDIDPGDDGIVTIVVDPEFHGSDTNLAYLSAMRLEATAIPEPGSALMLLSGLIGMAFCLRRKR